VKFRILFAARCKPPTSRCLDSYKSPVRVLGRDSNRGDVLTSRGTRTLLLRARTLISVRQAVFKMLSRKTGTVFYQATVMQQRVRSFPNSASNSTASRVEDSCCPVPNWPKVLIVFKPHLALDSKVL